MEEIISLEIGDYVLNFNEIKFDIKKFEFILHTDDLSVFELLGKNGKICNSNDFHITLNIGIRKWWLSPKSLMFLPFLNLSPLLFVNDLHLSANGHVYPAGNANEAALICPNLSLGSEILKTQSLSSILPVPCK